MKLEAVPCLILKVKKKWFKIVWSHITHLTYIFFVSRKSSFCVYSHHPIFADQSLLSDSVMYETASHWTMVEPFRPVGQPPTPIVLCVRQDKSRPTQLRLPVSRQWTSNKAVQVLVLGQYLSNNGLTTGLLKKICTLVKHAVTWNTLNAFAVNLHYIFPLTENKQFFIFIKCDLSLRHSWDLLKYFSQKKILKCWKFQRTSPFDLSSYYIVYNRNIL